MRIRLRRPVWGLAVALLTVSGCSSDLLVNNPNNPTTEAIVADPRGVNISAAGLESQLRALQGGLFYEAVFGREAYFLFPTDGRFSSHPLTTPTCNNCFHSGMYWAAPWALIRNADVFERNLAAGMRGSGRVPDAAESDALVGFARTLEAYAYYKIILAHHDRGAPIGVDADPTVIRPFESRDAVYAYISTRLNDAYAKLGNAGGTSFLFTPNAGWRAFGVDMSTPVGFRKFNRAIAARVLAIRGSLGCATCYQEALTALTGSFLGDGTALNDGAYSVFSLTSGDAANGLSNENPDIYAHPGILNGVAANDLRRSKIRSAPARSHPASLTTSITFNIFPTQSSPFPIIHREELILIRAEARWFTGDKAGALADINDIRLRAGGLPPTALTTAASNTDFVTELLEQRRLSLMFLGFRWQDVRRFGRLSDLPLDKPDHVRALQVEVPQQECVSRARTGDAALAGPGCP